MIISNICDSNMWLGGHIWPTKQSNTARKWTSSSSFHYNADHVWWQRKGHSSSECKMKSKAQHFEFLHQRRQQRKFRSWLQVNQICIFVKYKCWNYKNIKASMWRRWVQDFRSWQIQKIPVLCLSSTANGGNVAVFPERPGFDPNTTSWRRKDQ